jgi:serine/threonine protein kinase
LKKWHVTLIDFGFARALTKEDVHQEQPSSESTFMSDGDEGGGERQHSQQSLDTTTTGGSQWSQQSLNRSLSSSLKASRCDGKQQQRTTTKLHRQMSALGSPLFAAPEIKNKVYKVSLPDALSNSSTSVDDITRTISTFVADYGLLVDAYSLGCTIRYMMTGCVPHQSVAQAIANQNTVVDVLCRLMACGNSTKRRNKKPERTVRYRLVSDLPKEVQRLIEKSTLVDQIQRASVRAVRRYNWINDVLSATEDDGPPEVFDPADIQYLDFSNTKEEHARHVPTTCADH